MKNIQKLTFTFICLLTIAIHTYAIPIIVTRTTHMGGPNGYAHVYGFDQMVYDAGGAPFCIKETIDCWDPGTDACPKTAFKTTGGGTANIEDIVSNPSLIVALETLAAKAVNEIDNNNTSGNDFKRICIVENEITTCYLVTVKWESSINAQGKRTDTISLDYNKVTTP